MCREVVLVLHGSADRRYHEAAVAFFSAWRQHQPARSSHVCFLEHAEPLFAEKLAQLAASGSPVCILPLFLHQGMHSTRDIPDVMADIRQQFPAADIRVGGVLDDTEAMAEALTGRVGDTMPGAGAIVVLSHGADMAGTEKMVRQITSLVAEENRAAHVFPAWMTGTSTHLEDALEQLMKKGVDSVVVAPHLLLAGGWLGKVEALMDRYRRQFTHVSFALAPPLGTHPAIFRLMDARLTEAGA
ncbi:MAG: sirohydrochlorin chelatase [Mariprofundaceae bacterium]|nr:sirohydrochlorin chelatase [Mariprofundaceae bacterium]